MSEKPKVIRVEINETEYDSFAVSTVFHSGDSRIVEEFERHESAYRFAIDLAESYATNKRYVGIFEDGYLVS